MLQHTVHGRRLKKPTVQQKKNSGIHWNTQKKPFHDVKALTYEIRYNGVKKTWPIIFNAPLAESQE